MNNELPPELPSDQVVLERVFRLFSASLRKFISAIECLDSKVTDVNLLVPAIPFLLPSEGANRDRVKDHPVMFRKG